MASWEEEKVTESPISLSSSLTYTRTHGFRTNIRGAPAPRRRLRGRKLMSAAAGRKYNHSTFSVLSRYQYDLGAVINWAVAFADRVEVVKEGKIASRRANNAMHQISPFIHFQAFVK